MIPGLIILIIFFSFLLIKAADLVIVAIRRLAKETHTKVFTLSAIILAIGTSFPELFVGLTAALENSPAISLGDVTGSNIANLSLVAGIAAIFSGRIRVRGNFLKRDIWIAMVAGILPVFLMFDAVLSRVDGLILLAVYAGYATSFFRRRYEQIAEEQQELSFAYRFLRKLNHIDSRKRKELGKLFIGVALMLFSADMIVRFASMIAESVGVPTFLIGVVIVAIGTSLPELAFSFRSLEDHEPSMFFGNLLGSTIANSTLVIGVVSIITPIHVVFIGKYLIAVAAFFAIYITFWYFIRSKHRLDRWEAFMLILMYITFVLIEFIK